MASEWLHTTDNSTQYSFITCALSLALTAKFEPLVNARCWLISEEEAKPSINSCAHYVLGMTMQSGIQRACLPLKD